MALNDNLWFPSEHDDAFVDHMWVSSEYDDGFNDEVWVPSEYDDAYYDDVWDPSDYDDAYNDDVWVPSDYDDACYDHMWAVGDHGDVIKDEVWIASEHGDSFNDPMCIAIEQDDFHSLKSLLQSGADVNEPLRASKTALHLAAELGRTKLVDLLLDEGADVQRPLDNGWNALHLAAYHGNVSVLESLLKQGADVHSTTMQGRTALIIAAQHCDVERVNMLLAYGADITTTCYSGWGPLHYAARYGGTEVLKVLLQHEANIPSRNLDGPTPLHLAAKREDPEAVEILLQHGASTRCSYGCGVIALHCAAEFGGTKVVEVLLDHGSDIRSICSGGQTSMHLAAKRNRRDVVRTLWNAGGNPIQKNNFGETPLSFLPHSSELAAEIRIAPHSPTLPRRVGAEPSLSELQQLWQRTKTSIMTPEQLLFAIKPGSITCFADIVLAHHLLLLALRQRVLTCSQLALLGGSHDYLLENVYLPGLRLHLDIELKAWLSDMLTYAEGHNLIQAGNASLVKVADELRSEIGDHRPQMHSALVSVARQINALNNPVGASEQCSNQTVLRFDTLCDRSETLSDMKSLAISLRQLHSLLRGQDRERTIAGAVRFCLSMIPVVGGVPSGKSIYFRSIRFSSDAASAVKDIQAVDIGNFKTAAFLASDDYINQLDPVVRERVEAIVHETDFTELPVLHKCICDAVEELERSEEPAETSSEKSTDKCTECTDDHPEESTDMCSDETTDERSEKATEKRTEESSDKRCEKTTDKRCEESTDKRSEESTEITREGEIDSELRQRFHIFASRSLADLGEEPHGDIDIELRQRYQIFASRSPAVKCNISAQDAISELKHVLQLRLDRSHCKETVDEDVVDDIVIDHMDATTGRIDEKEFINAYHILASKYPIDKSPEEPSELRQTFRNALGSHNVLKIKIAKRLLRGLFTNSDGQSKDFSTSLSFTRSRRDWNEEEVDKAFRDHSSSGRFIDEEGFVLVGMQVLFAKRQNM